MTDKYDYSVPLDEMPREDLIDGYDVRGWLKDHYSTISHALKLAEKVTRKPSKEMHNAGAAAFDLPENVDDVFHAMIRQAQKEVGDDA